MLQERLHLLEALTLHHGDCIGADAQVHDICFTECRIHLHPPDIDLYRAFCTPFDESDAPLPYLRRDRRIVDSSHVLFVLPKTMKEETRSGTWATCRYAINQLVPLFVIWPDGSVSPWKDGEVVPWERVNGLRS